MAALDEGRFAEVIGRLSLDVDFSAGVSLLCAHAARLYLANPHARIVYLHGITGTSALRLRSPWLDDEGRRAALGWLAQCVAALHATSMQAPASPVVEAPRERFEDLAERASAGADDHAIKLVEAAWREHRLAPRPELLAAAAVADG